MKDIGWPEKEQRSLNESESRYLKRWVLEAIWIKKTIKNLHSDGQPAIPGSPDTW